MIRLDSDFLDESPHPDPIQLALDRVTDRRGLRDLAQALEAERVRQLLEFVHEAEMLPEDVVHVLGPGWLTSRLPA
jgi:hypothetical protein